jgi:hypothetical protein
MSVPFLIATNFVGDLCGRVLHPKPVLLGWGMFESQTKLAAFIIPSCVADSYGAAESRALSNLAIDMAAYARWLVR